MILNFKSSMQVSAMHEGSAGPRSAHQNHPPTGRRERTPMKIHAEAHHLGHPTARATPSPTGSLSASATVRSPHPARMTVQDTLGSTPRPTQALIRSTTFCVILGESDWNRADQMGSAAAWTWLTEEATHTAPRTGVLLNLSGFVMGPLAAERVVQTDRSSRQDHRKVRPA